MTHRDIITITKFKMLGFKDIETKYIPEIKLNRISCKINEKVGRSFYDVPFEAYCNVESKIILSRHFLFQAIIEAYEEWQKKDHKDKVAYLESNGIK